MDGADEERAPSSLLLRRRAPPCWHMPYMKGAGGDDGTAGWADGKVVSLPRQRRCLDGGSIPSRARCIFFAFLTHHTLYGDSIKSMDQWSNR